MASNSQDQEIFYSPSTKPRTVKKFTKTYQKKGLWPLLKKMSHNYAADDIRAAADDGPETREKAAAVKGTTSNGLPMTLLKAETNISKTSTADKSVGSKRSGCILPLFVANMSLLILLNMIVKIYTNAVVRTLERRFGLRSVQTGLLESANDVLQICIVIFIGYFGRKGHKPRIICVTVLFSAVAGFMMASPHFLMSSSYDTDHQRLVNATSESISNSEIATNRFCLNWNTSGDAISGDQCDQEQKSSLAESSQTAVHPAFYVFLTAQFISGIGGSGLHTLSLAYIDENSPGSKSSFYIGVITSMYALGPMLGSMLAAMSLRLPENLLSAVNSGPSDPSWIGCWWLGYVICATVTLAASIPLWFFPKSCSEKATNARTKETEDFAEKSNITQDEKTISMARREIEEFPRRLLHLFRNKAYVVSLLSVVCFGYVVLGTYANLVRYIEIHFHERAFVGSLIAGLVGGLAGAVGSLFGGFLMSRLKIRVRGAVNIIIFSEIVCTIGLVIVLLLGCPQLKMAGQMDPGEHRFTVLTECNKNCACLTTRKSYEPVCGSDNLTYFSACAAGCMIFVNGTYSECGCIGSGETDSHGGISWGRGEGGMEEGIDGGRGGWAQPGLCRPPCNLLIPFAATMFLASLLGSVGKVPSTIVNLRIVDEDERAFALSVHSFARNLLAFMPAPLLYGSLIDSACILWQTTCKKTGSCLLFSTDRFRYVTYGVALFFESIDFLMTILLFLFVRKMVFRAEDTDRKENRLENETEKQKEES